MPVHGVGGVQVQDRADGDPGQVGPAQPAGEQVPGGRPQPLDLPAGTRLGSARSVASRCRYSSTRPPVRRCELAGLEQVQGPLRVGEDPDRLGPADLERVGVPEPAQAGGEVGQGVVEVQRVEGVQAHVDLGGGRAGVVVQGDVPGGQRGLFVGDRPVRVVVQDRLSMIRRTRVTVRCWGSQASILSTQVTISRGQPRGQGGGLPGPPRGHGAGQDQVEEPGQPVPQLQGVADQLPAGVVGDPQVRGQLGRCELRDLRGALPGQRDQALAVQVHLTPARPAAPSRGTGCRSAHSAAATSSSAAAASSAWRAARARSSTVRVPVPGSDPAWVVTSNMCSILVGATDTHQPGYRICGEPDVVVSRRRWGASSTTGVPLARLLNHCAPATPGADAHPAPYSPRCCVSSRHLPRDVVSTSSTTGVAGRLLNHRSGRGLDKLDHRKSSRGGLHS